MNANLTGLLLVTGISAPGIKDAILETLAPFTITIRDQQVMDIRDRYFLAIYFDLDNKVNSIIITNKKNFHINKDLTSPESPGGTCSAPTRWGVPPPRIPPYIWSFWIV